MNKLPVPQAIFDQHIALLGKTRSGKSSTMRVLIEHLIDEGNPVVIIDPKGDWYGLKSSADGKHAGYPVVIFGGEHADVPINERSGAIVAELVATGNRSAIVDLGGWLPSAMLRFWIDFAAAFFKHRRGRRFIAIDEVHNFAPKGKVLSPDAGMALYWAKRLAGEGLGKGINLIVASQRQQKVHNDLLTMCETLFAMRVIHPSDRKVIAEWIEECGTGDDVDIIGTLAEMKRGEAWVWSPEAGFGPSRIRFPLFKTFDSFKPQIGESHEKLKGWAEVNLDDVKAQMAETIKEHDANDPKKLRVRIAELERMAKTGPKAPTEVADQKVIDRAVRAHDDKWREHYKKVNGVIVGAAKAFEGIKKLSEGIVKLSDEALSFTTLQVIPYISEKDTNHPTAQQLSAMPRKNTTAKIHVIKEDPDGQINGSQMRILKALAEIEAIGQNPAPIEMVAFWSKLKPNTGTWRAYIGGLRSAGFVADTELTDAGRAKIGSADQPDRDEILKRIMGLWNSKQAAMLDVLVEAYPGVVSKTDIGEKVGLIADTGTFRAYIGAMSKAGLVEYPSKGNAKAAKWLGESW